MKEYTEVSKQLYALLSDEEQDMFQALADALNNGTATEAEKRKYVIRSFWLFDNTNRILGLQTRSSTTTVRRSSRPFTNTWESWFW